MQTLKEKHDEIIKESQMVQSLIKLYPDLKETSSRNRIWLYSSLVNTKVNLVEFSYSCGCCEDAVLYAYPFLITENGIKVFSDPIKYTIGEKCVIGGERAYAGWEDKVRVYGIPEDIINQINVHLKNNPEQEYEE